MITNVRKENESDWLEVLSSAVSGMREYAANNPEIVESIDKNLVALNDLLSPSTELNLELIIPEDGEEYMNLALTSSDGLIGMSVAGTDASSLLNSLEYVLESFICDDSMNDDFDCDYDEEYIELS